MSILTQCPGCSQKLSVPESALGKKVRCQACSAVFVAEAPKSEPPAAPVEAIAPPPPAPVKTEAPPTASAPTAITADVDVLPKPPVVKPVPADEPQRDSVSKNASLRKKPAGNGGKV